jgi:predicted amidohydrolase YtcJ
VADLIVIDRNILEVPIATLHETRVLMTIIDGEVVHEQAGAITMTA